MHLAVLGLSRKLATMARKFNSENLYFKHTEAQRHRDYFEHGKLGKNGNFRLLREFRVQKNINVRINVLICVLINVSP
jgi:hypothetical protein